MQYSLQALCIRQAHTILELADPPVMSGCATLIEQATPYLALALYRGAHQDKGLRSITTDLARSKPNRFIQDAPADDEWARSEASLLRLCAESPKDLALIHSVVLRALMESGILDISKS